MIVTYLGLAILCWTCYTLGKHQAYKRLQPFVHQYHQYTLAMASVVRQLKSVISNRDATITTLRQQVKSGRETILDLEGKLILSAKNNQTTEEET